MLTLGTAAIRLAAEEDIPIYFFDERGDPIACTRSPYFESLATLRRKQVYFSDHLEGALWVIEQFRMKTHFQLDVFKAILRIRKSLKDEVAEVQTQMLKRLDKLGLLEEEPDANWTKKVMGWEGATARLYWRQLSKMLPLEWQYKSRSRRPSLDPFNATINYLYGFLYAEVEQALFNAGLDPHLGILHQDEYDRPTLAYDLIEVFRPWADRMVVENILRSKVEFEWYESKDEGVWMGNSGKKFWIPKWNGYMLDKIRWEGKQLSRRAHIHRKAAELANLIRTINP